MLRVPPDPYLRFDTCDYSLDPALLGHRTITALEHTRALKADRGASAETPVEIRPLARYDALIA